MTLSVREYAGSEAVDFLTRRWRDLYVQDPLATPFQSPAWLTGWAHQLPPTTSPFILAATSASGRPLAALALARRDSTAGSRFVPLSAPHAHYVRAVGPHADDPAVARALAIQLLLFAEIGAAAIDVTDVPSTSALAHYLSAVCEDDTWDCTTKASAAIELPVDYSTLSRSAQREHQRRLRTWTRLTRDHTVTYHRTRHTQDLLTACNTLCDLHRRRRPGQPHPHTSTDIPKARQWRSVLRNLDAHHACIATLSVDGQVLAGQLLLTSSQTRESARCSFSLIPAADPAYRHLAPGHALLRHLVAELPAEGIYALHLGRVAPNLRTYRAPHRAHWTNTLSAATTRQGATA
ncbi:GNAT family N-acetyltransferase [Streptomyces sp. NPDC088747]|uniref:GNAT family N-acetyltransferase n=1 Tax=Streptomyces sp. NPDC088747 TaxID=3365886 RepID=UPI003812A89D